MKLRKNFRIELNISLLRKQCDFFGFTENHEDESILIFHRCSSSLNVKSDSFEKIRIYQCHELHTGNTPRSIMTKGNSVTKGTTYGNFVRGNKDKLMITYRRERSHVYSMRGACGVLFEGEIHFFGGILNDEPTYGIPNFARQHFVIETKRSGQLVKMTKKAELEIAISFSSCGTFEMTSEYFPWFKKMLYFYALMNCTQEPVIYLMEN